ncbi:MAG: HK97 family phage prohead protease [Bacteroidales bacterium]|nr:HK97 family phage prohead protease [Bacteroidales bacterium]
MRENERKLPEKLEINFVMADEEVNRKKWRLLLSGLNLENFLKNPIAIRQHDTWSVPVGRWENVRVEKGQLLGTLVFDKNDEEAVKLYWKYKDGFMNAVSIHIVPIEESEDESLLLPGQKYPTIVKSELLEVSVVTLPGNANAVKLLNMDGSEYKLSIITKKMEKKEKEEKVQDVQKNPEMEAMRLELEKQKKINVKNLLAIHKSRGVVGEKEVEHLEKLAMLDYETTEMMLQAREVVEGKEEKEPSEKKGEGTEGRQLAEELKRFQHGEKQEQQDERAGWTYLDWYKKDQKGLLSMQEKEPKKYEQLVNSWEKECKSKGLNLGE